MLKNSIPFLLGLISRCSIQNQHRIAAVLAFFASRIPGRPKQQSRQNVRLCFPELDPQEQDAFVKQSILHSSYTLLELAAAWCWPIERALALIDQQYICPEFSQSSKGRIVIAPHLGNWELLNLWLSTQGSLMSLYKPQRNARLNQFMLKARSRAGAKLLPTDTSGVRQLLRGLKQGGTAMILPDQRPRRRHARIRARFFDRPAYTTTLIQSLLSKTQCDVFIAIVYRQTDSTRFALRIEVLDPVKIAAKQDQSVQYMNDEIERLAREYPHQYQWGYSRFSGEVSDGNLD